MAEQKKPVKVYHPAFSDVVEEVPADDVTAWTEAGWRKTPVKDDASK